MGIFDVAQSMVNSAAGIIVSDTSIDISSVTANFKRGSWQWTSAPVQAQSIFVGFTMWALTICIFIIVYSRMIEIYLVTSIAPIPMATMLNRKSGGMRQNYLRSLFALGFQGFLIIVCVAIYAVLVKSISVSTDISKAIWTCMGATRCCCASRSLKRWEPCKIHLQRALKLRAKVPSLTVKIMHLEDYIEEPLKRLHELINVEGLGRI